MNLYLDDDCASRLLTRLLSQAGHNVQLPVDVNMSGAADPSHLTHAIRESRVLLTANYDDFEQLHDLVIQAAGHHPGILVIRKENNPKRDLTPRGIVRAIGNFEAANVPIADQFVIVNHWR
jgi:predicted nuclease of predicted toxin-antitoxin system